MERSYRRQTFAFEGPAEYRIEVLGRLLESYAARLGGMVISTRSRKDGMLVTSMVGHLRDQAELNGILTTLYDLHLPILAVQRLTRE